MNKLKLIIKDALNRLKLDLCANVPYVNLYTFLEFTKLRAAHK